MIIQVILQRSLLADLLVRLDLVADHEVLEVDTAQTALGSLLHLGNVLLAVLQRFEFAYI